MRRKLTLLALFAVATLVSACSDITGPSQDDPSRCQVVQGSDTRCS